MSLVYVYLSGLWQRRGRGGITPAADLLTEAGTVLLTESGEPINA